MSDEEDPDPARGIDEVLPDASEMRTTIIIECDECGTTGMMHSTAEPMERYLWHCEECDEDRVHRRVIATDDAREIER